MSVKYDLDSDAPGSLMQQIQDLVRSPNEEPAKSTNNNKKPQHSYYRRPGRGHNHDLCDACGEGGDLICCDKCPSSFHLECHDPPLTESNIPIGLWLCHTCRSTQKTKLSNDPVTSNVPIKIEHSSDNSRSNTPVNDVEIPTNENVRTLRKRRNSTVSISSDNSLTERAVNKSGSNLYSLRPKSQLQQQNVSEQSVKPAIPLTPFEELIQAAAIMNPTQFELPREMSIHLPFPGTDKVESIGKNNTRKLNRNNCKNKSHELDSQGLVPLPAKTCFYCRRSCKKAPLIACDYCSSYFHQDCLDPPLTALPSGLWMCPNHPENLIDWKLVSSVSATERLKLWNRFSGPLDHETIKAEFFRKVHCKNPPFRYKVTRKVRDKIEAPEMIKYHYKNPPTLLPSLKQVLRCESVFKRGFTSEVFPEDLRRQIDEELKEFENANRKLSSEQITEEKSPTHDDNNVDMEIIQMKEDEIKKTIIESKMGREKINKKSTVEMITETDTAKRLKIECDSDIDKELEFLDISVIKHLAFQRLQQIINDNSMLVEKLQERTASKYILDACKKESVNNLPLPSQLLTKEDIERISREFTVNNNTVDSMDRKSKFYIDNNESGDYADKKIKDEKDEKDDELINITELKTDMEKAIEIARRIEQPLIQSKIRARAVLIPVKEIFDGNKWFTTKSIDAAAYMRYRNLSIGYGFGNTLKLSLIGSCKQISQEHAVIFYDNITRNYELLNYSEYGTEVNGQLYSCNFKEYPMTPARIDEQKIFYENLKKVIDKRRCITETKKKSDSNACMAAPQLFPSCECKTRPQLQEGWEGTAILSHGTLIRFGCLPFVFAVVNFDDEDEDESSEDDN